MTTIETSSIPFSPEPPAPAGLVGRPPEEGGGKTGFAEVFAGLHPQPPHLSRTPPVAAMDADTDTDTDPAQPDPLLSPVLLQKVPLSASMQLIMPTSPAPDLASLQAFARTQGLDEQTIRQLFGDGWTDAQATASALTPTGQFSPLEMPAMAVDAKDAVAVVGAVAVTGLASLGGWTVTTGMGGTDSGGELPPPGVAPPGLLPPAWLRAAQPGRPGLAATPTPPPTLNASDPAVEVIEIDVLGAGAGTDTDVAEDPLLAGGLRHPQGLTGSPAGLLRSLGLSAEASTATQLNPSSPSGLTVVSKTAGALPMMAGDLLRQDPAALAALEDSLPGGDASLPEVQTDAPSGPQSPVWTGRPQGPQESLALAPRAAAEAALPAGAGGQTAESLAHKLGEAIAQRLMSRLEQGNWHFRFVLNPRNMGEVQVNLHMHGGGLDGSFLASQASTRELLNDGLQRLRDTLNASGMNVASLDVGAGHSSRQGQQSMASASPPPAMASRAAGQGVTEGLMPLRHRDSLGGEQGWDVLV